MQTQLLGVTITNQVSGIVAGPPIVDLDRARGVALRADFSYGSGGISLTAWIQSTPDGGATWFDVACFAFATANKSRVVNLSALTPVTMLATPGDAVLANDTAIDGLLGDQLRVKYTSTGTYAGGTTLNIFAIPR
jgi:hypothetical protein